MNQALCRCSFLALLFGIITPLTAQGNDKSRVDRPRRKVEPASEYSSYAKDLRFYTARRKAFESRGVKPTVPPDLSSNPHDPEFKFRGYAKLKPARKKSAINEGKSDPGFKIGGKQKMSPSEKAAQNQLIDDYGFVLISNGGEMWNWRPKNLGKQLAKARKNRHGDANVRQSPPSHWHRDGDALPERKPPPKGYKDEGMIDGRDNRVLRSNYSGHNMSAYPWLSLGALVKDGTGSIINGIPDIECSAAKISDRLLYTAAHCIVDAGKGGDSLTLRDWIPGADGISWIKNGTESNPNGNKNIAWYVVEKHFVEKGWWSRDFAVLVLYDNQHSCDLPHFGYRFDGSLTNQRVWNFGYPDEKEKCEASPAQKDKCSGSLYGMKAKITRTTASYIFHKHDVQIGQSGSPLYDFYSGGRYVIGNVSTNSRFNSNRAIKINRAVFDFIDGVKSKYPATCSR